MNIYVGNLAEATAEPKLRETFETFGEVTKVNIAMDKDSNTRRGFAFVEMTSDEHAKKAIADLNGKDLDGNPLKVNESTSKTNNDKPA
jgi:cold-inducible RNA-binding protein